MKLAVLGTGMVGQAIAGKLASLGHEVAMGSRSANNERARAWAEEAGERASHGSFAEASASADVVFNCTAGGASLEALLAAGEVNLYCRVMVEPARVPGDHDVFVCGNDDRAKAKVQELLAAFGWPEGSIFDLGDISAARGTEAYVLFWVRLVGVGGGPDLNVKVVRPA